MTLDDLELYKFEFSENFADLGCNNSQHIRGIAHYALYKFTYLNK